jgi:hypothetical protein
MNRELLIYVIVASWLAIIGTCVWVVAIHWLSESP